jgi:hypothetical protein
MVMVAAGCVHGQGSSRHEVASAGASKPMLGAFASSARQLLLPAPRRAPAPPLQGEIVDDCVMREGDWSCLTAQGSWQRCDLGRSPPPTDQQGQLLVAQVGACTAALAC